MRNAVGRSDHHESELSAVCALLTSYCEKSDVLAAKQKFGEHAEPWMDSTAIS